MGDFSLTTFSSGGRLKQIDNALAAVARGETSIGIKAKDGVVIAGEKKLNSILIDDQSFHKVVSLANHIGAVYSGLGTDFKKLIQVGRKQAITYSLQYQEPIFVNSLCREIADEVQQYTISGGVRPFGISMLVAGYDDEGPHMFQIDPSGAFYGWKATAIGKNSKNAQTFLEKRYLPDMGIEDAIHTALLTLKEGYEGQINSVNIEVGIIKSSDRVFRRLSPEEIEDYLKPINA